MAKKLNTPYPLSDAAADAESGKAMDRASRAKTVAGANKAMRVPNPVKTVADAEMVAADLSDVNKKLRAARRPR